MTTLRAAAMVGLVLGAAPSTEAGSKPVIPLKEAKLNIEHNATDLDTGFQGAIDSEGWKQLDIIGPDGTVLATFKGKGKLGKLGLTELFFETVDRRTSTCRSTRCSRSSRRGTTGSWDRPWRTARAPGRPKASRC
jgi:hypothetical protein